MGKPGWFTPQVPGLFRERADGDWDYFPLGRFGRGYRVRPFDIYHLSNALRRFQIILVGALSLGFFAVEVAVSHIGGASGDVAVGKSVAGALSLAAFIGVVISGIFLLRAYVRRLMKGVPFSETPLTRAEGDYLEAARYSKSSILLGVVLSSFGFIGILIGIWRVLPSADWVDVTGLLFIAAVFGFGSWAYARLWRHRPR